MLRSLLLLFALSAGVTARADTPAASSPPVAGPLTAEELFRPGSLGQAELSPDGRNLGAIVTDEHDQRHLVIVSLKDHKLSGLRGHDKFEMSTFRWLGDDRVLFNVTKEKLYSWGLYAAKLASIDRHYAINNFDVTSIVGVPRLRPGRVLVWIVQSAEQGGDPGGLLELDAYHTPSDLRPDPNAAVVRSYPPPKGGIVRNWRSNHDGELALCETWSEGQAHLHRYLRDQKSWRAVALDLEAVTPMSLDPNDRFLWVVTHAEKAGYELRRYDLDTGLLDQPVYADSSYDFSGGRLFFSEQGGELVGLTYVQRKRITVWFASDYAAIQALVDRNYPDTDNVLIDRDRGERKFLFHVSGPQQPGLYTLLDLDAKSLNRMATAAPWLNGRPLQPVQPVSFQTRDHVKLEGYLTLPTGASAQHPVPLVVLVHGGPWVRDTPDFNPEVQFLASRGYAVFQPNYRGSSGYAPAISRENQFDFRRMHDDVTDATRAMLRVPLVDPKRVAIMGGSFGGFLALAGVTFEDGLYRCAITQCGVFDWERFIKSKRDGARPGEYQVLLDKLGHPGRDRERLEQISPLAHADQIHVPVFIAHGTEDNVVEVTQSKKLASALKKRGVPYETFFRAVEGHGFYNYKNRVEYYHRVEAFLATHLGDAPPASGKR